jgi:hypothetical protein
MDISVSEIEFCTLYVVAERWILGCILRFIHVKNHFSDTLICCHRIVSRDRSPDLASNLPPLLPHLFERTLWTRRMRADSVISDKFCGQKVTSFVDQTELTRLLEFHRRAFRERASSGSSTRLGNSVQAVHEAKRIPSTMSRVMKRASLSTGVHLGKSVSLKCERANL